MEDAKDEAESIRGEKVKEVVEVFERIVDNFIRLFCQAVELTFCSLAIWAAADVETVESQ